MKFRTLLLLSVSLLVLASACCKKEDEETTYLSFVGTPDFELPIFIGVGDTFTLTPASVSRSSEDTKTELPGCYWTITQLNIRDTVRREGDPASVPFSYTFEVPDTLQTITVLCGVYGEGYTNSTASLSSIIVRTQGANSSLQGFDYPKPIYRDARDGRLYHYTTVGGLDWMAENLAYAGSGYSYLNCSVVDGLFGRYYSWNDAMNACPEGWRLPTNEEFLSFNNAFLGTPGGQALTTFTAGAGNHMANAYFNGSRMWEYWPDVTPVNTSGFSLLPLGYVAIQGDSVAQMDALQYALFWTADELNEEQAYYRSVYLKYDTISCETGYKEYMALNVRCVREKPGE